MAFPSDGFAPKSIGIRSFPYRIGLKSTRIEVKSMCFEPKLMRIETKSTRIRLELYCIGLKSMNFKLGQYRFDSFLCGDASVPRSFRLFPHHFGSLLMHRGRNQLDDGCGGRFWARNRGIRLKPASP